MPFSIPQAASALGVLWLDAPAAISAEDGAHILGLYRYDFTGAAPSEPEPGTPVVSAGGGGGGWRGRGGAALGVKERRRISRMVDEAFAKLYGPKTPPAEVKEAVVAAVEQDLAPMPVLDIEGLARVHKALVDLQAALDAQAEDEAEVLALLNLVH